MSALSSDILVVYKASGLNSIHCISTQSSESPDADHCAFVLDKKHRESIHKIVFQLDFRHLALSFSPETSHLKYNKILL